MSQLDLLDASAHYHWRSREPRPAACYRPAVQEPDLAEYRFEDPDPVSELLSGSVGSQPNVSRNLSGGDTDAARPPVPKLIDPDRDPDGRLEALGRRFDWKAG